MAYKNARRPIDCRSIVKKNTFWEGTTKNRIQIGLILGIAYIVYLFLTAAANIYAWHSPSQFLVSSIAILFNNPTISEHITHVVFPLHNFAYLVIIALILLTCFHAVILTQIQNELIFAKQKIIRRTKIFSRMPYLFTNFCMLGIAIIPPCLWVITGQNVYMRHWYYFLLPLITMFAILAMHKNELFSEAGGKDFFTNCKFVVIELLIVLILLSLIFLIFFYAWTIIAFLLLIIVTTDIGAWFFGKLFGTVKICSYSPKKTYQGLVMGAILATILSIIYCYLLFFVVAQQHKASNWTFLIAIGVVVFFLSLISQGSDICFSIIKREAKIKDYSNIFHSHGGMLDRFDGFIGCYIAGAVILFVMFSKFPR